MAYTTINKHTDYFNTKIYTGNGSAGHSITGVGFQPDLVWAKHRNGASGHHWYDAIRGATKRIRSDNLDAEGNSTTGLTAFGTDGFTVGTDSGLNSNSNTFASWNWKANGAGSSNSDGSITSTVSANTTAGFSIVKWVGTGSNATIGHGLGAKPAMIITKSTSHSGSWYTYNKSPDATDFLKLNSTDGTSDNATVWNDTEPTTSVFTTGTAFDSGRTFIAYCFTEKVGYSKFGKYTGNGNADGAFVYTGFKPSFVMIKEISSSGYQWTIVDNKRNPTNDGSMKWLFADNSGVETTESTWDLLSNGFKQRANHSYVNHSGTHIYMAFGQSLVGSNNVPCTAR
ncbi:hypothetical protein P121_gp46 [Pelagibacter phage HTVC121P]|nr:hypothetical protein P121_gp46 [Pelagibacter phage HTVC121P]